MNHRQLQALVRMALEAEALENGAGTPFDAPTRRRRHLAPVAGLALAACAALAAVGVWLGSRPGESSAAPAPGGPVVHTVASPPVASLRDPASSWALLAVFRGWDGECRCLHVEVPEVAEHRPLEMVGPAELLAMALQAPCSVPVERLVVLGIAGPDEHLPTSVEEAEALAACVAASAPGPAPDAAALELTAAECLPPGVRVVAEVFEAARPAPR